MFGLAYPKGYELAGKGEDIKTLLEQAMKDGETYEKNVKASLDQVIEARRGYIERTW
jgi:hypothetical protein